MFRKITVLAVLAAAAAAAYLGILRTTETFPAGSPSAKTPDNIVLTPAGDLSSSVSVTWRTSAAIADGVVRYGKKNAPEHETTETRATLTEIRSPELRDDKTIRCFSATLSGLDSGTTYSYRVGSGKQNIWSDAAEFTTAERTPESLTFVYLGDTQVNPEKTGALLDAVEERHPEAAFHMIGGDIVDRGERRNEWDDFLKNTHGVFSRKPLAPAMGNHDPGVGNRGGGIFNAYFNTPNRNPNAPEQVGNYTFRSGAARFIVINQFTVFTQTKWLEKELRAANADGAKFIIVMFHHPVYNPRRHRGNASAEKLWVPLFDKYKVDLVLTGHDHSYARSRPLRAGKPVPPGEFGTTYIVSNACDKFYEYEKLDTAAIQFGNTATYQIITLAAGENGKAEVRYRACSPDGKTVDEFAYAKETR